MAHSSANAQKPNRCTDVEIGSSATITQNLLLCAVNFNKMTVKELKEEIANLPDDMEVVLQKDSEGNGYSPLAGADPDAVYIPDSTWSGDVYSMEWTADDACMSEEEWEEIKSKPRTLILYPVN